MSGPQIKFSIIIATYNRREAVSFVLDRLSKIDCPGLEIIVVDNASSDDTAVILEEKFKGIRLIKLKENSGYEAYNIGLALANGSYIIFMDNDAFLKEDALQRIEKRFKLEQALGVIALNVSVHGRDTSETSTWQPDTPNFHGAAVAIRKEVLERVGGYDKSYFIVHTDLELATRVLHHGYGIVYDKDIIAYHMRSERARSKNVSIYYSTRNAIFYYWKYYPLCYASILTFREIIYGFTRGLREKSLAFYFSGLFLGLINIPRIAVQRTPLRRESFLRMKEYLDNNFRSPLFKKLFLKLQNG
jgi:GT2 family glycosyltransferase